MSQEQFLKHQQTVTRRIGWWFLQPGDIVRGVVKSLGLKGGEKIKPLGFIYIVSTRREPLSEITKSECILEGFPDMEPEGLIKMYCAQYGWYPEKNINRIEFEHF